MIYNNKMEKIKLDKKDKKLLSYIFHNFREPITKIAKKCMISREQAEYRIKKYEEKGLIKKYLVFFDLYSLGYNKNYIIKLRVKNPNIDKLSQIKTNEGILIFTRVQCYGAWDYILTVLTKETLNILDFISDLYELWKENLLDYDIFEPIELHYFPLKIFGVNKEENKLSLYETEKKKIDELDKKIIHEISKNAKIKIINIANNIHEKVETVNYRLKKLKKNIILGYRILLDLNKIDYKLVQLVLKLNNLSKSNKNKILTYGSRRENIHAVGIGVGKYNTIFQIIYKTPSELIEEINEIKETFSENLVEYELIHIENELSPKTI